MRFLTTAVFTIYYLTVVFLCSFTGPNLTPLTVNAFYAPTLNAMSKCNVILFYLDDYNVFNHLCPYHSPTNLPTYSDKQLP